MFNKLRKMAVVAVTAGALVLAGGIAQADNGKPDSVIDTTKAGNIHLTKYDNAESAKEATGLSNQAPTGKTIAGIEFTLKEVTKAPGIASLDITNPSQLKTLGSLDANTIAENPNLYGLAVPQLKDGGSANSTGKTNPAGTMEWKGLKLGVYLLTETNSTASDGTSYTPAQPSLIFLPTTDPTTQDKWIEDGKDYGIWIYPKNSKNDDLKAVSDANLQVGDRITYSIKASVPAVQELKKPLATRKYNLQTFGFMDYLDKKLEFKSEDAEKYLSVSYGKGDTPSQDLDKSDYVSSIAENQIKVYLTETGLEKVGKAKATGQANFVFLQFKPLVKSQGIIPNTSFTFKNTGEGKSTTKPDDLTPSKGNRTNTTVSAWGQIRVMKKDDSGTALRDAEFAVYAADKQGKIDYNKRIFEQKTFKSSPDGLVKIEGLHTNDWADNKDSAASEQSKSYFLVETKAPKGYELLAQPIEFKINLLQKVTTSTTWDIDASGKIIKGSEKTQTVWTHDGVDLQDPKTIELQTNLLGGNEVLSEQAQVINIKSKPKLPLTGGAGITIFGLLGAAIIGGGIFAAKRNSKKA